MNQIKASAALLILIVSLWAGDASLEIYGWASPWSRFPTEQQISHLTHLICYPIYPRENGTVYSDFSDNALDSLVNMARRNGVKVIFSFGSGNIDPGLKIEASEEFRNTFVSNLMEITENYNLDGIDNSCEPPYHYYRPEDEAIKHQELKAMERQWNGLNQAVRDSLDNRFGKNSKSYTLTISGSNELWFSSSEFQQDNSVYPDSCWKNGDRILLMNYNDALGANHSTYESMVRQVNAYIEMGIPKEIMVPGFLFFGQGIWGSRQLNDGTTIESVVSYDKIMEDFPNLPLDQDTVTYSFYNPTDTVIDSTDTTLIDTIDIVYGFNSVMTIRRKLDYIFNEGLAGSMHWTISNDAPLTSEKSLIREISASEPFTSRVRVDNEFCDTILNNSDFLLKYPLDNYFSCDSGSLDFNFILSGRHLAYIENDTLIICGDSLSGRNITTVSVTAKSSLDNRDYRTIPLVIACAPEQTDTVENIESSNYILSENWEASEGIICDSSSVYAGTNSSGDTSIQIVGIIENSGGWADVNLTSQLNESISLGNDSSVIITYRGNATSPIFQPFFSIVDSDSVIFSIPLSEFSGDWVTDTLYQENFTHAWEQPDHFKFDEIIKMSVVLGLLDENAVLDFEVKEIHIRGNEITSVNSTMKKRELQINLTQNSINISRPLSSHHSLQIVDLHGRQIWRGAIAGNQNSIALPTMAAGIYILQISGKELSSSMKILIR